MNLTKKILSLTALALIQISTYGTTKARLLKIALGGATVYAGYKILYPTSPHEYAKIIYMDPSATPEEIENLNDTLLC